MYYQVLLLVQRIFTITAIVKVPNASMLYAVYKMIHQTLMKYLALDFCVSPICTICTVAVQYITDFCTSNVLLLEYYHYFKMGMMSTSGNII